MKEDWPPLKSRVKIGLTQYGIVTRWNEDGFEVTYVVKNTITGEPSFNMPSIIKTTCYCVDGKWMCDDERMYLY
jgi:hypothetical protein